MQNCSFWPDAERRLWMHPACDSTSDHRAPGATCPFRSDATIDGLFCWHCANAAAMVTGWKPMQCVGVERLLHVCKELERHQHVILAERPNFLDGVDILMVACIRHCRGRCWRVRRTFGAVAAALTCWPAIVEGQARCWTLIFACLELGRVSSFALRPCGLS